MTTSNETTSTSTKQTIWKFSVSFLSKETVVEMPAGAQILTVGTQDGTTVLWAMVNPDAPKTKRVFRAVWTGHSCDDVKLGETHKYLTTFNAPKAIGDGFNVTHLFERIANDVVVQQNGIGMPMQPAQA